MHINEHVSNAIHLHMYVPFFSFLLLLDFYCQGAFIDLPKMNGSYWKINTLKIRRMNCSTIQQQPLQWPTLDMSARGGRDAHTLYLFHHLFTTTPSPHSFIAPSPYILSPVPFATCPFRQTDTYENNTFPCHL